MNKEELNEQVAGYLAIVKAIAQAVRELGEVPSGTLYAGLMDRLSLGYYQQVIDTLKGTGLIEETPAHLLRWIGPKPL